MQAPGFWWRNPEDSGLTSRLLSPLSAVYAAGTARRVARPPTLSPQVPVVCVGNLTVGGSGKTPAVMALASEVRRRSKRPAVVTRGYGGRERGPIEVDPARMTAADVGDEPMLLAAFAPVFVARDRAAGTRLAIDGGAQVVLLDDGFQNPSVTRDLNLIVVDAAVGFGNGRVLPAGPLREPVAAGLARADALIVLGEDQQRESFADRWPETSGIPRLDARLSPLPTGMEWEGARVVAFAGIGRPEKFFSTLRTLGAEVVREIPLADHQPFTGTLLTRLRGEAERAGAQLVTTEKDAVRLPQDFRRETLTLPVRLEWVELAEMATLLDRSLFRR